jgi:hypothetical protein
MAEPTLIQIFGAGATQDANTITIQKSALVAQGLTATADNTAESLMVGILKIASTALTQANYDANEDQSLIVASGFPSIIYRGTTAYRSNPIEVRLTKLDDGAIIDPDDY